MSSTKLPYGLLKHLYDYHRVNDKLINLSWDEFRINAEMIIADGPLWNTEEVIDLHEHYHESPKECVKIPHQHPYLKNKRYA